MVSVPDFLGHHRTQPGTRNRSSQGKEVSPKAHSGVSVSLPALTEKSVRREEAHREVQQVYLAIGKGKGSRYRHRLEREQELLQPGKSKVLVPRGAVRAGMGKCTLK